MLVCHHNADAMLAVRREIMLVGHRDADATLAVRR
jgi:hypothetical protein